MLYLPLFYLVLLGYAGYQFSTFVVTDAVLSAGVINSLYSRVGLMGFVFFLFASFEFLFKVRERGLDERVKGVPGAYRRTVGTQLLTLLTLALVYCSLTAGMAQFLAFRALPFDMAYCVNTLLSSALYLLGPALIALMIGAVGAQYLNRLAFYVVGLVLVFLVSDFSEYFVMVAGYQSGDTFGIPFGLTLLKVCGLFRSLLPIYVLTNDMSFGQGLEPFRWELLLFWLALCAAVLFWKLRGKKRLTFQITSGVMAAVCVFGLVGYWNPGSNWRSPPISRLDNIVSSDLYYYGSGEGELNNRQYNETKPAAFKVTACDLSLSLWKQLTGDATLTLDGTMLDAYEFTLYHGYTINSVTDGNGTPLDYERWQDYLRVQNPENTALTAVTIHYTGYHPEYYSTAQGAYLPGFFAYYPMEGLFPVFDSKRLCLNIDTLPESARRFTVRVNSTCSVYTNLDRQPDGSFQGNARQLTLVGGMYKANTENDTVVIRPFDLEAKDYKSILNYRLRMIEDATGYAYPLPALHNVFVSPNFMFPLSGSSDPVFLDDALLCSDDTEGLKAAAVQVVASTLPKTDTKARVRSALLGMAQSLVGEDETGAGEFTNQFGYEIEGEYIYVDSFSKEYNAEREIQYYIYKALLGADVKTIYAALDAYLKDETDTRDQLDFAKALAEQYPVKEAGQ